MIALRSPVAFRSSADRALLRSGHPQKQLRPSTGFVVCAGVRPSDSQPRPSSIGGPVRRQSSKPAVQCNAEKKDVKIVADFVQNYDHPQWILHRSSWRYLRHFLTMFVRSRTTGNLFGPVIFITAVAAAACVTYDYLKTQLGVAALQTLPMMPFNLTAGTLGLLLVFRTNASYGRWDESRKLWGLVTNRIRDLNRQAATWFPDQPQKKDLLAVLQRWSVAFCHSLKCHLREGGHLPTELKNVLPQHELDALLASKHKPLYALQVMSEAIRASKADSYKQMMMDANMTVFEDCVGACERIFKSPIPQSYTRHTSRFMIVWHTLLPIALVPQLGWMTVPVTALVAYFMMGVEDIGVTIEEPYKQLALDATCAGLNANTSACHVEDLPSAASIVDRAALEAFVPQGNPSMAA
uniref:Uncharacterized protein n=1 Tax=Tetraselmis chuii TaxID=63592 RepID=A0A7S1X865_9CHLO|mmetsp:Transcript_38012/g.68168  ORF Transcript_38012/g.68168 Transcript_38012/m.68168 type:complete len:409 (+) Transcript_38012:211-1437(+)